MESGHYKFSISLGCDEFGRSFSDGTRGKLRTTMVQAGGKARVPMLKAGQVWPIAALGI